MNRDINKNEKRDFNKDAPNWDENPTRVRLSADIATAIVNRVTLTLQMDVLDFGCGTGLVTLALAPSVRRVVGLDTSVGMLAVLAAKIAAEKMTHVEGRLFDLEKGDEIDERFHSIVSAMTLHHIPDIQALFAKWFDWLLPGGTIAAADLDKEDGGFHPDNTGVFHFGFDRETVKTALGRVGFTKIMFTDATTVVRKRDTGATDTYPIFLVTAEKPGAL